MEILLHKKVLKTAIKSKMNRTERRPVASKRRRRSSSKSLKSASSIVSCNTLKSYMEIRRWSGLTLAIIKRKELLWSCRLMVKTLWIFPIKWRAFWKTYSRSRARACLRFANLDLEGVVLTRNTWRLTLPARSFSRLRFNRWTLRKRSGAPSQSLQAKIPQLPMTSFLRPRRGTKTLFLPLSGSKVSHSLRQPVQLWLK
jgi:hypothetical protein